jgi:hypothetical protein
MEDASAVPLQVSFSRFPSAQLPQIFIKRLAHRKGEATFQSDNIATLSLIRQFVSKRATSKNMHLNISTESVSEATDQLLQRIHPDLLKEIERRKRIQLARALGDVVTNQKAQNSTDQWISDEFQQILDAGIEDQADKIDLYLGNFPCPV